MLFGFCHSAQAKWWNSDWTIRKKITINASSDVTGFKDSLGETVVLVRLHDGNFQFSAAKDDGGDIRFVAADDKTPLTFHLEKYDPVLAEAFAWVRIPKISSGNANTFWLYYGNTGGSAMRVDNPKGTYGSETVLVYHFAEHGQPPNDSSAAGNNAQNAGIAVDGSLIDGGLRLDGKRVITIPVSSSLVWSNGAALTGSLWIKPATLDPSAVILSRNDDANSFLLGLNSGIPYITVNGQTSPAGKPIAVGEWHNLAVIASGSRIELFLDGESYDTLGVALPAMNSPILIGSDGKDNSTGFVGEIDELELSKVARSTAAIKLAAINQGGGDKASELMTFGQDEQTSSWFSGGYLGVILKSLTADGWVVIGILAIMAIVSWLVMINKASYLNVIRKGNDLFIKEWRHVAADLTVLDHGSVESRNAFGSQIGVEGQRAMRKAPLFRIYHMGSDELQSRLAADTGGKSKALSGRSIQAIRATLDGGLVRETQKLNSRMVILTIAISGGPFLGLLGTVIGVMITFAAIAVQGDVNVNAIAPGIAAALAATVAGLAVAIPSLFGYNYLLSQVKDTTSDMHVFIDEFVTRMAEFYGDE